MAHREGGILAHASPFFIKKSQSSSGELIPPGRRVDMPQIASGLNIGGEVPFGTLPVLEGISTTVMATMASDKRCD